MATLHRRGVKGYVTLNTLVSRASCAGVESIVRRVAAAGVDAVLVQDLGLVPTDSRDLPRTCRFTPRRR